jgi:hypothetical protein
VLAAALLPVVLLTQVYQWTDASGQLHFTDDLATVPRGVRVTTPAGEPVQVLSPQRPTPAPGATSPGPRAAPPKEGRSHDEDGPGVRSGESAVRPRLRDEAAPVVRLGRLPPDLRPGDAELLQGAVAAAQASAALRAFGGLRWSIAVDVVASAEQLRRFGVPEWAGGFAVSPRQVYLLSPYLGVASHGRPRPWHQLALHEVAHAQQQQWTGAAEVPRWFREGYAMYVAAEAPGASPSDVAWWAVRHGGSAPLQRTWDDARRADRALFAYGVSLEGVQLLVTVAGEDGVRRLLQAMRDGQPFAGAFRHATGEDLATFERRFLEGVRPRYQERGE